MDKELKRSASTKGDIRNAIFQLGLQLKSGANIELINNWGVGGGGGGGVGVPLLKKNIQCQHLCPLHTVLQKVQWSLEVFLHVACM